MIKVISFFPGIAIETSILVFTCIYCGEKKEGGGGCVDTWMYFIASFHFSSE